MANVRHRTKLEKQRRKRRRGRRIRQVLLIILLVILLAIVAGAAFVWHKYGKTIKECKAEATQIAEGSTLKDFEMSEGTSIYDASGDLITTLGTDTKERSDLAYDEIPDTVKNAFIAVEDRSFWKNKGYDLKGVARILVNYIRTGGEVKQGASTITQQLARNIYLSNERTITRKITEIFLAADLTKMYSKEDILTAYINNVFFANNFYGIEAAAEGYFGKSASELTLSEMAYLCAIPNRPAYYDPWSNPDNALTRRDKILNDMYGCGYITEDQLKEALNEQIVINSKPDTSASSEYDPQKEAFSSYAINCAARYLMEYEGFSFRYSWDSEDDYESYQEEYNDAYESAKSELYSKAYTIYTSLDPDAQDKLQDVLDEDLDASTTEVDDSGLYALQGSITAVDNSTGKVVAVVGGRSQTEASGGMNRAFQAYRQPGSAIKPLIIYTPALEQGYTADSQLQDIDVDAANQSGTDVDSLTGSTMTLQEAVEQSSNGCAYYLYNIIKPKTGLSYLLKMGFDKIVPSDYNLASGLGGLTYGVTTVQMAGAYAALENDGAYRETTCITDLLDPDGNSIYKDADEVQVYDSDAAEEMTEILEGVLTDGTGKNAQLDRDFTTAGKTGTTNDNKDAWFCGYAPASGYKVGQGYTVAVWLGYDTPRSDESRLYGYKLPSTVWKDAMEALIGDDVEFKKSSKQIAKEKAAAEEEAAQEAAAQAAAEQSASDQTAASNARSTIASISSASTVEEATNLYNTAISEAGSISDSTLKQTVISEATSALNSKKSELESQSSQTTTGEDGQSQTDQSQTDQSQTDQSGQDQDGQAGQTQ